MGEVCEDRLELKICVTGLVRAAAQCLRVEAFILSWPGDFVTSLVASNPGRLGFFFFFAMTK